MILPDVKLLFEILTIGTSAIAAILWFMSANTSLTKIGAGIEELDKVELLSRDLQRAAHWNFWAALTTGFAVIAQILSRAM
jgi:hypothetical protein